MCVGVHTYICMFHVYVTLLSAQECVTCVHTCHRHRMHTKIHACDIQTYTPDTLQKWLWKILEDDVRKVLWGCEQTQEYQLGLANNDPNEPTIHSTARLKLHEIASAKFTGCGRAIPNEQTIGQQLIKHSFSQAWNNRPSIIKQPPKNSQCSTGCTSWKLSPFWPVKVKAFIVIPLAACR